MGLNFANEVIRVVEDLGSISTLRGGNENIPT